MGASWSALEKTNDHKYFLQRETERQKTEEGVLKRRKVKNISKHTMYKIKHTYHSGKKQT